MPECRVSALEPKVPAPQPRVSEPEPKVSTSEPKVSRSEPKDGSRDFVQEAGGARRRRGPRLVSASSNRSWQLSVADAVQEVPRRHLQTELMNPVIGGLEAPISRRTRGVLEPERVRHAIKDVSLGPAQL